MKHQQRCLLLFSPWEIITNKDKLATELQENKKKEVKRKKQKQPTKEPTKKTKNKKPLSKL
jgi:hypothetical protein